MSKNRGDYVAAQERFVRNTSVRTVIALANQSEIDRAHEDDMAEEHWFEPEREIEAINEKSTTA